MKFESAEFRHHYLRGAMADADDGRRIEVSNPSTGKVIGSVPLMGRAETVRAVANAAAAQTGWRSLLAKERAGILRRWHDLMVENIEILAALLTAEQGKPLAEARNEILYAASFIEWFAEEAKRLYGDVIPGHQSDKRIMVIKQPVGVVAAITPWNFPAAMITRKVGPALAAGCTIIVKPAVQTPLSAFALAALAHRAGVPEDAFQVLTGSAEEIGAELTRNPLIRKISFTGSTEVGRKLMAQSAPDLKRLSLELGGNAPFIVFDDADLPEAVEGAIASKYRNTGQTCVCTNRFLVQSRIYDAFVSALAERVARLKVGDGFDPDVMQGPLIDDKALAKVEEHVADAVAKGARLAAGGARHSSGGTFFEPTILVDAQPEMLVAREETFGPVAAIFRFETEEQAIGLANDTEFGLAGYFYTRDVSRVWRVAEALACGIVGINTGLISTECAPFGGMKQSGFGREGSKYGIEDYVDLKYLCLSI